MRTVMFLWASWLTLALSPSAEAATYEVAQRHPQASDQGLGTAERPWKTISHAASNVAPGDTVNIRDGIYRERVVIKTDGGSNAPIRFQAAPGERVVVTGADHLIGWQKADAERSIYRVPWPHRFNTWSKTMTHPGDEYHRLIGRCEQVVVDGHLLRQVLAAGQLAPGAFFVDVTNQMLLVWDGGSRDINQVFVEGSVRQEILRIEGAHVQVRGMHFRLAANAAQHGAVVLAGRNDLLEDCSLEGMNSSGATFTGEDQVVRRCVFRDNGQMGFGANQAHRLLFTQCLVENNNTKGFDRGWEAGGDKLVLTRDAVLERSRFVRNRGNGIWFDIGNENCTVRQCLIADNEDSGIFYEISFGLHAQNNVIIGNGFAPNPGGWGAQAGISISSSPDCVIERNLIYGNREGFNFREQTRTTPRIGNKAEVPVWNHDQLIQRNLIACNRDAQIWGWFDMKDNRHWPAGKAIDIKPAEAKAGAKPGDIAAAYGAKDNEASAQSLSLEKLRLRFIENVYFASSGQKWFEWGVTWGKHESYSSLNDFQAALGIDTRSRVLEPAFADPIARDFRLSSEMMSMSQLEQSYPRGPIPEVLLGVRQP
jgi:hypothetical protein